MLHEHYSGELIRKHYEGHFILFFTSLPRFIEDNEDWINKRKCKPKNPVHFLFPQALLFALNACERGKRNAAYVLAVYLGVIVKRHVQAALKRELARRLTQTQGKNVRPI